MCLWSTEKQIVSIFNMLKTLISNIVPRTLYIYQAKNGAASIQEGAPVRINTVCAIFYSQNYAL